MTTINLCVIGDSNVGKHYLCNRLETGEYGRVWKDIYTIKSCAYTYNVSLLDTSNVVDMPYNINCVIFVFDHTNRISYDNICQAIRIFTGFCGQVPFILYGTKVDLGQIVVSFSDIKIHREVRCRYYPVSSKSFYNIYQGMHHFDTITNLNEVCFPITVYSKNARNM